jgi:hypothetical protein
MVVLHKPQWNGSLSEASGERSQCKDYFSIEAEKACAKSGAGIWSVESCGDGDALSYLGCPWYIDLKVLY